MPGVARTLSGAESTSRILLVRTLLAWTLLCPGSVGAESAGPGPAGPSPAGADSAGTGPAGTARRSRPGLSRVPSSASGAAGEPGMQDPESVKPESLKPSASGRAAAPARPSTTTLPPNCSGRSPMASMDPFWYRGLTILPLTRPTHGTTTGRTTRRCPWLSSRTRAWGAIKNQRGRGGVTAELRKLIPNGLHRTTLPKTPDKTWREGGYVDN
jgi:hypothetical protein